MLTFVSGAITMGFLLSALFFLRFWRRTRDRLFLLFAAAFALLAVQRAALAGFTGAQVEDTMPFYLLRLAAFVLILVAIVDKNRASPA